MTKKEFIISQLAEYVQDPSRCAMVGDIRCNING